MKFKFLPSYIWLLLAAVLFGLLPAACTPAMAADVTITAANVTPSAQARTIRRTAAVAITAGQLVYVEALSGQLKLADTNSATEEARSADGIAVTSGAVGTMISVVTKDPALVLGGTTAKGTVYILSGTAGGIAPVADLTTGWYGHVVGIGVSTTVVAFDAGGVAMSVAQ